MFGPLREAQQMFERAANDMKKLTLKKKNEDGSE
jgi:hypothetical protein